MKKLSIILSVILLVTPMFAQQQTGNIYGKVVDEDGIPLPGVTVTLFGTKIAPIPVTSSSEGIFRFLSLYPSRGYTIKLELDGFKTKTETGIIVAVGQNTELVLAMEVGTLEEEVTVVAVSPVIDTKKTAISTTLNYELLQSVPIVRDPWVILQMTPAIQVDRENVGGNESGQQSSYVALGGGAWNDTWTMDGVNITDPAAMGASPTYYDYDTFEEVNVTIGGADIEQQTGGVALNLVTRRGENRVTFGGRFYYTEDYFQAKPHGETFEEIEEIFPGYGYNKIRDIKDYGFNIGGPFLKDKVWWWGSYGIQDIKVSMINGSNDDTFLANYAAKLNVQLIPENRLELFIHAGSKLKWGRSSSSSYPSGYNQHGKYHFGSPIIKIQDEHMFGDSLFVSAKFGFTDAGFGLWPADDEDLTRIRTYDVANVLYSSQSWFFSGRPNKHFNVHGIYFNDNFLGGSHEIKMGFEFVDRRDEWTSGQAGNMRYAFNYNRPTVDWDGDGTRDIVLDKFGIDLRYLVITNGSWQGGPEGCYQWSGFFSDTATWGRMTVKLGLRYDYQVSFTKGMDSRTILSQDTDKTWWENCYEVQQTVLGPAVSQAIAGIFPGSKVPEVKTSDTIPWKSLSPRLGLTYDITGDGKTIAKLSGAYYGGRMSSWPAYLWQRGGSWGQLIFWWNDANGDEQTQFKELYWADYSTSARTAYRAFDDNGNFLGDWDREENLMWAGFNPQNPNETTDPWYFVDPNWHGDKTWEVIASLEREILPDFMIGADFIWRKYSDWWVEREYADYFGGTLLKRTDYVEAPNRVPESYTAPDGTVVDLGDAGGRPFYVWKEGINDVYGWYATNTPSDYYDQYLGLTVRVVKRLSNRWMLDGSFSWQSQKNYWGETWPLEPTDQWALDGQTYAYVIGGGSGKGPVAVFSRWMVKAQGLYQLPFDFNISFNFNAREGHILPTQINVQDYSSPNPYSTGTTMYTKVFGDERLPIFWNLNFRLEKMLRIGDRGRVYLMADAFNIFNQIILNRKRDINPGTIYLHNSPPTFSENARSGEPNEVLNPRVFRFGVRFQF